MKVEGIFKLFTVEREGKSAMMVYKTRFLYICNMLGNIQAVFSKKKFNFSSHILPFLKWKPKYLLTFVKNKGSFKIRTSLLF